MFGASRQRERRGIPLEPRKQKLTGIVNNWLHWTGNINGGVRRVKEHEFFEELNWEDLGTACAHVVTRRPMYASKHHEECLIRL